MMNLWYDDNHGSSSIIMMDSFVSSTPDFPPFAFAAVPPMPAPPPAFLSPDTLQQRLQALIDVPSSGGSWTYAIFWQFSVDFSGQSLLCWGDGYYKGEENKPTNKPTSLNPEQEYRKRVLRELNSLISGNPPTASNDGAFDEEVTDTEWFFLISMTQSFSSGEDLPGQAYLGSNPIWAAGSDRLKSSPCNRAMQGACFALQTVVCIPVLNGVVEVGSTEMVFQSPNLMNKVRVLFSGDNQGQIQDVLADEGENDPATIWINDPATIWINDPHPPPDEIQTQTQTRPQNHQSQTQNRIQTPQSNNNNNGTNPGKLINSDVESKAPSEIHPQNAHQTLHQNHVHHQNHQQQQQQGFFSRELNFSDYAIDGSKNRSVSPLKPESDASNFTFHGGSLVKDTCLYMEQTNDEVRVNKSQPATVNTDVIGSNDIEGQKSDDDYDFWIDDDVESQSDDDVAKVKENVVKEREKRGRLALLLQACKCSKGVVGSSTQRSVEYDELGDECQDSEDATSPSKSKEDERDGKKHSKISCPRFNSSVRPQNVELVVGLQFADKKQFRSAFENYRIVNGFNIKIITSDKHRFQAECMGGGCEWRIWASECRN